MLIIVEGPSLFVGSLSLRYLRDFLLNDKAQFWSSPRRNDHRSSKKFFVLFSFELQTNVVDFAFMGAMAWSRRCVSFLLTDSLGMCRCLDSEASVVIRDATWCVVERTLGHVWFRGHQNPEQLGEVVMKT